MMTTAQIKRQIKTVLIEEGRPHKPADVAKVYHCYQAPMYGSSAPDDVAQSIEDSIEAAIDLAE